MCNYVVVGVGNLILSDDAVGPLAVRRAREELGGFDGRVTFEENYSEGIDLLDLLTGHYRALIVDSVATGKSPPGTLHVFSPASIDCLRQDTPANAHSFNLPTLLALGRKCGYPMPVEVVIFGIEVADMVTVSEELTASVATGLGAVVMKIRETIESWLSIDEGGCPQTLTDRTPAH